MVTAEKQRGHAPTRARCLSARRSKAACGGGGLTTTPPTPAGAGPKLPWNAEKTWAGSLCFAVQTSTLRTARGYLEQYSIQVRVECRDPEAGSTAADPKYGRHARGLEPHSLVPSTDDLDRIDKAKRTAHHHHILSQSSAPAYQISAPPAYSEGPVARQHAKCVCSAPLRPYG